MKTIDQETIDFAEDFFFKFTDAQLMERSEEFGKRQPAIALYYTAIKQELENEFQWAILWKFGLMVDYCFNSFYGTIPLIHKQKVSDKLGWIIKDIKENPEPSGKTNYPKEMEQAGQVPMLKHIEAKCEAMILEFNNFPESEACAVFNGLITMTWLYQDEVDKMSITPER